MMVDCLVFGAVDSMFLNSIESWAVFGAVRCVGCGSGGSVWPSKMGREKCAGTKCSAAWIMFFWSSKIAFVLRPVNSNCNV